MTSRERIVTAMDHREPDRVPLDLAGTHVTGISRRAYDALRAHLGMPEVATGHKPNPPNTETLHSDGPSAHHDAPTTPAMGSKAGPAGQDIKPEGASAPVLGK